MGNWDHLIGGAKFEQHPVTPLAFALAGTTIPAGAPREKFVTLGSPQFQKNAGSCVPHARSEALEAEALSRTGAVIQLCRQDMYYGGRALEHNGAESQDGGTYPSLMDQFLRSYGTVTEAHKPYDPNVVTTWRPPASWDAERRLLTANLQPIPVTVEAIVTELVADRAVPFDHNVYRQMANGPTSGIEIGPDGGKILGGHDRIFMGYSLDRPVQNFGTGCFWILNWWEGYCLAHPLIAQSMYAAFKTSVSIIPFSVLQAKNFIQGAARIARGLPVEV